MLELNDAVLEVVSGGNRSSFNFKLTNKNYSDASFSHVKLGKDSTLMVVVTQSIG